MSALILTRYTTDDAHRPSRTCRDDRARRATAAAAPHPPGGDQRLSARSDERLPDRGRQTAAESREGYRNATCHVAANGPVSSMLTNRPRRTATTAGDRALAPAVDLGYQGVGLRTRSTQRSLSTSTSSAQSMAGKCSAVDMKAGKSHAGTRKGRQCSAPH